MVQAVRVIVTTSNKYLWALRPFAYLFNKFWSDEQAVVVGHYKPPQFDLPLNFSLIQMLPTQPRRTRWSNGIISLLNKIDDNIFVFMLEDFFLVRPVSQSAIHELYNFMLGHPEIGRIGLTDELYEEERGVFHTKLNDIALLKSKFTHPFYLSCQASLWRRAAFLEVLFPNTSAHDFEISVKPIQGHLPASELSFRVLGVRDSAVRYVRAVHNTDPNVWHTHDLDARGSPHDRSFSKALVDEVIREVPLPADVSWLSWGEIE